MAIRFLPGQLLPALRVEHRPAQVDAVFETNIAALQGDLNQVLPLANGQLLVLSPGTLQLGTVSRTGLLRLSADGTPDPAFTLSIAPATIVPQAVVEQPDGKLVVIGRAHGSGASVPAVVRLSASGNQDTGFQALVNGGINNNTRRQPPVASRWQHSPRRHV